MSNTSGTVSKAKAVGEAFREKNVTFLAGSIAYNAFVSLVPILLFFVLVVAFFGTGWQDQMLAIITENVSPAIGSFIERLFATQASSATGSSIVGFVVLIWSALKIFRGLDTAFSEIYEVDADNSIVDQIKDGLVVLVSLALAIAAMVAVTSVFGAFGGTIPYLGLLLPFVLALGLVVAFFPIYYVFPDVDVSAREILPGVVVAAVGWALLQGLFQIYVAHSTAGGTDIVTGIMLLLTWLYFTGVVLLLGAVINAVLGGYTEFHSRTRS
ncbi:ribonuclease BN [Halogeometricum pallidum JCM 14848]|uniref:Ribonuclease BN n=1 Tax=Halogeometricum pallidum JCM 14848 TaxID=1227487 RepID=M0CYZ9_HALPD|nr:YihY/virulence factor BrkB family protein [Halogeometricum pallidum]ELZ28445.1 ribonuclease BN [Halogeometricum pallidum JCM 14848]